MPRGVGQIRRRRSCSTSVRIFPLKLCIFRRAAAAALSLRAWIDYRGRMKNTTLVNHPPAVAVPADNRPLVAPIYQSVKFSFDDTGETLRYLRGEREGFFYSRNANPTLTQLELTAGATAGQGRLPADGLGRGDDRRESAGLVQAGDHVLLFVESYGPTRYIVQHILAKFGVTHTMLSIEDLPGIERCSKRSRRVW